MVMTYRFNSTRLRKSFTQSCLYNKLLGDSVNEEPKEHLAIRYGNTVGLLVEAIKEQQEQIETLATSGKLQMFNNGDTCKWIIIF